MYIDDAVVPGHRGVHDGRDTHAVTRVEAVLLVVVLLVVLLVGQQQRGKAQARGEKVHDVLVALGGRNHQWRVAAVVPARQHVCRHGVAAVVRPRRSGVEDEELHDGQMTVLRPQVQRRVARQVRVEDPFGIVFQDPLYSGSSVPVPYFLFFIYIFTPSRPEREWEGVHQEIVGVYAAAQADRDVYPVTG